MGLPGARQRRKGIGRRRNAFSLWRETLYGRKEQKKNFAMLDSVEHFQSANALMSPYYLSDIFYESLVFKIYSY
ncbi:MAG: hypothetical protein KHZ29_02410 [Desulfovibrionaceae bacterium]|nr:hypothetical protein [Desulfovibrionaceae bacterium]